MTRNVTRQSSSASAASPGPSAHPAPVAPPPPSQGSTQGKEMSDDAKSYYNAVSLFSQQKYEQAMEDYKAIVNSAADREYGIKSLFEIGRCLYSLDDYDTCIKHFTTMIQKYPKHPELVDTLFYLGVCNEKNGDTGKAESFYKKILSMSSEDMPVHRKARKALRNLSGS